MKQSRGFSLIELLIVVAVIGIIASIAIPNLVKSRLAANEASAIASVRNIVTAQITYAATTGEGDFAPDLATLSSPEVALVDEVLGSGQKDGYTFTMTAEDGTFAITATPLSPGRTGTRTFTATESGVITWDGGSGS